MNNTEKLLRAFIEASGYDIEETEEMKIPSGQILIPAEYKVTKKSPLGVYLPTQETNDEKN